MAEATKEQVIEYLEQELRRLRSDDLTGEELQKLITRVRHDPKNRLVRTLLKRAQETVLQIPYSSARLEVIAELAGAYMAAGQRHVAEKIIFRIGDISTTNKAKILVIKVLCEKNNFIEAREFAKGIYRVYGNMTGFAWLAIAEKSGDEHDYAVAQKQILDKNDFDLELAIAVSRAKTDAGAALQQIRNREEKTYMMGGRYTAALLALAKEYARQGLFPQSKAIAHALDSSAQIEVELIIAKQTGDEKALQICRELIDHTYPLHCRTDEYVRYFAEIAAISGNEKDFEVCKTMTEKVSPGTSQSDGYSALAVAYAARDNVPMARELINKIVDPYWEAMTLIKIARILCSRD